MLVVLAGVVLMFAELVVSSNISCSNTTFCQDQLVYSYCDSQQHCVCDKFYYLQSGLSPSCKECPGVQESCEESNCCTRGLVCYRGIHVCIYFYQTWTVTDSEKLRLQEVAQCVLGGALILTAVMLFILFRKACSRQNTTRPARSRSFPSFNSIQRMVMMQLQDRPPPYNSEYMHPWKLPTETDPPPSYIEAIAALGHDNHMFILEEPSGGDPYSCIQAYAVTPHQLTSPSTNETTSPPLNTALSESHCSESSNRLSRHFAPQVSHNLRPHTSIEANETYDNRENNGFTGEVYI